MCELLPNPLHVFLIAVGFLNQLGVEDVLQFHALHQPRQGVFWEWLRPVARLSALTYVVSDALQLLEADLVHLPRGGRGTTPSMGAPMFKLLAQGTLQVPVDHGGSSGQSTKASELLSLKILVLLLKLISFLED